MNCVALKCEISLHSQAKDTHRLCRRKLLFNHHTPLLHRYGKLWVYHFASQHQVTLHCSDLDNKMPRSLTLDGPGLLHNSSKCYVTSSEFQNLPDNIPIATEHEIQQLQELTPKAVQQLEEIRSKVTAPQHTFELHSLLHIHRTSLLQERRTNWFIAISTSLCTILFLSIIGYLFYSRLSNINCITSKPKTNPSTSEISSELQEPHGLGREEQAPDQRILFTSYPLQRTD